MMQSRYKNVYYLIISFNYVFVGKEGKQGRERKGREGKVRKGREEKGRKGR